MKRYYVERSYIFTVERYNTQKIKKVVKDAGGVNVRTSLQFGWSNQPSVVTFSATPKTLAEIKKMLEKALGFHILIGEKDW